MITPSNTLSPSLSHTHSLTFSFTHLHIIALCNGDIDGGLRLPPPCCTHSLTVHSFLGFPTAVQTAVHV